METADYGPDDAAARGQDRGARTEPSTAEQAQAAAGSLREKAEERARAVAEERKSAGAEQLGGVARAMEKASDELKKTMPTAAQGVDAAAQRLGELASALRERSVDDLLKQASEFGRRQPGAFFAGAVAAGFALSRFVKSSGDR